MNDSKMVDICECDVADKEALALFRMKRAEWKRCLIGDSYSVSQQISHILWNDIVFRTFNEARKISIADGSDDTGLNGPMIDLMDEGFVVSQVMAIRRLSDPNFYDPKKAVLSLRRIIDDIGDSLDVFNRENYICFKGIKFEGLTHEKDGINWMHWDRKQKYFDRLSGVSIKNRSRNDKIDKKIISSLRSELNTCNDLRTYASKFIAHASDNPGKSKLTDRLKGITLNNLDEAYKAIIKCGSFLGAVILYEHTLGGVPVPQYNQFENIEKAVIRTKDISKLGQYWRAREKDVNSWDNEIWPSM